MEERIRTMAPAPSDLPEAQGYTPLPDPPASWDAAAAKDAETTATEAARVFFQRGADQEQWWSALEPYLDSSAVPAYATVRTDHLPPAKVTGNGTVTEKPATAYVVTVSVPTTGGPASVVMSREGAGTPWKVNRITLADEDGQK